MSNINKIPRILGCIGSVNFFQKVSTIGFNFSDPKTLDPLQLNIPIPKNKKHACDIQAIHSNINIQYLYESHLTAMSCDLRCLSRSFWSYDSPSVHC